MTIRRHRCATCGKHTLTFGALMRHYLRTHPTLIPQPADP